MKKVKFLKFTMAFFACVLAVTMGSCDKNNDPKVPDLKCTPSKVEVAPGKTATVTVSGGTAPCHAYVKVLPNFQVSPI